MKKVLSKIPNKHHLSIALGLFTLVQLSYLDFIPIWDGRWYLEMLYEAMNQPFSLANYNLSGHLSFMYSLPLALTQWISHGSVILIRLLHLLIGVVGIFSFYKLLQALFKGKYTTEVFWGTLIFALHPLFLATSLGPNLDFPVTCFFLAMAAAATYERYGLFVLAALFTLFSRETGLGLYLAFVCGYGLFMILNGAWKSWKKLKLPLIVATIPLMAYGFHLLYKISVQGNTLGWGGKSTQVVSLFQLLFTFHPENPTTFTHLFQIFVMNFNWIFSLLMIVALVLGALGKQIKKKSDLHTPLFYALLITFLLNGMVLVNYITFVLPRYRLPLLPIFIIFGILSILRIFPKNGKVRTIVLAIIFFLFVAQGFRTIDPSSKIALRHFNFGDHEMICMKHHVSIDDCGRDHSIYNPQYAHIMRLVDKSIREMIWEGDELNILGHEGMNHPYIVPNVDRAQMKMTLKKADKKTIISPTLFTFRGSRPHAPSKIIMHMNYSELPFKINYLKFPMYGAETDLKKLEQLGYVSVKEILLESQGHHLRMWAMEKRNPPRIIPEN